jgi:hypothetical protein
MHVKERIMQVQHRRRGKSVPAHFTVQLMDAIGPTRAHNALGVSTTALYKARRTGQVAKVLEVAAEGALKSSLRKVATGTDTAPARQNPLKYKAAPTPPLPPPGDDTALFLVEVPADKRDIVERVVRQFGAVIVH